MIILEVALIILALVVFTTVLALIFDVFDYYAYIFGSMCFVVGIAFLIIQVYIVTIVLFASGFLGYLATEVYKRIKDH